MKTIIILLLATVFSTESKSASLEVARGVYTHHFIDYGTPRNEDNKLIALSYRFDNDWGVLSANFTNSYDVNTTALAITYSVIKYKAIELELVTGIMKGYTEWELHDKLCPFGENSDYCFLIAPKLSVELFSYKGVTPKLSALLIGKAVAVTIGVSYEF